MMEINKNQIEICLKLIEGKMRWGSGENWTTKDFQHLSSKIYEETKITLSVATLKRIWGKISYNSNPTITTLDTLVKFIGYENWRVFEQETNTEIQEQPQVEKTKKKLKNFSISSLYIAGALGFLVILLGWIQFVKSEPEKEPLNFSDYEFGSRKMVTEGIPNSVLFNYDATAADDKDSVFIQQSWDARLKAQVSKNKKKHSSIYYRPGYFKAKLVVRDTIVSEHDLFIKTIGWLPLAEYGNDTPVYFSEDEVIRKDGSLYISEEQMKAKNMAMQPKVPWVNYYYMTDDLAELNMQNFIFETRIKNTYKEGAGICQISTVELRFAGAFIKIPLSVKGCVARIGLFDENGGIPDSSKLGMDFSDWVNIKLVFKEGKGELYLNDDFAYNLNFTHRYNELKGIHYAFQGGGQIDEVLFKKLDGTVIYSESF